MTTTLETFRTFWENFWFIKEARAHQGRDPQGAGLDDSPTDAAQRPAALFQSQGRRSCMARDPLRHALPL